METAQRLSLHNGSVPSIPHESTHASPALHHCHRAKLKRSTGVAQEHCGEGYGEGNGKGYGEDLQVSPTQALHCTIAKEASSNEEMVMVKIMVNRVKRNWR